MCIYVFMYLPIHTHAGAHIHLLIYIHMYIRTHTYTCIYTLTGNALLDCVLHMSHSRMHTNYVRIF